MGQSTDAILVWGFDLGDAEELPEAIRDRIDHLQDEGYDELRDLERRTGAEMVQHCAGEYPHYIIGVTARKTVARRGRPKVIMSLELDAAAGQAAIDAFAKSLGAEPKPGEWLLASDWS